MDGAIGAAKPLPKEVKQAIEQFQTSVAELKRLKVIRSHKYLGDIAEYLCTYHFEMTLSADQRQPGWDATKDGKRYQVKYNGGKKTNIDVGNPAEYHAVIVVLGPGSCLRPAKAESGKFIIYEPILSEEFESTPDGKRFYLAKAQLKDKKFDLY